MHKSFLKLKSKSKKRYVSWLVESTTNWLRNQETDETFEKQKFCHMCHPLFWDICLSWRSYFKPKDHQIKGTPHRATILDRVLFYVCSRYGQILALTLIGCYNTAARSDCLSETPQDESAYSSRDCFRKWSAVGGEKDRFCCLLYCFMVSWLENMP